MKKNISILTRSHPIPDGQVTLLGSVDGVTPTMTLVEMGEERLLVDCGVRRERGQPVVLPQDALSVKTLLMTHAHNDHIGGLPQLLKDGAIQNVFATGATLEIAKALLDDGIRLNGGTYSDQRAFQRRFKEVAIPIKYGTRFAPTASSDLSARFTEAGHILGSAGIELRSLKSRIIISGDMGRPGTPILRDFNTTWRDDRPVDLVLIETTYGDRIQEHTPDDLEEQLERTIKRALRDGGHILVPSFAIGRTQVLLYLLNTLVESKRIPDLPVAVDTPLGLRITDTYKAFRRLYDKEALQKIEDGDDPIDFDQLYAVKESKHSKVLSTLKQPMLIIAGSGMCTGGRIVGHMMELLPKPETNVIFVGYQAPGTPGRQIQTLGENRAPGETPMVSFFGEQVPLRAEVDTLHGISAHADQEELAQWLRAIPNVKKVALHHGDRDAQRGFRDYLMKNRRG